MLSIAVVEDEQKWQQFAISEIQKYYNDKPEIDCFKTGEEFLKADHEYDIVFMDVELPGNDGFSVAEKYVACHSDVILIIMTTHTEMSRKGYLVNAFRYVDKFHPEEFAEALQSAEKRKRQLMPVVFYVPKLGEVKVRCRDIVYLESNNHDLKIRTVADLFAFRDKMESYKLTLEGLGFFLIHRSFLVNLDHVVDFDAKNARMSNGDLLPVSRNKYKEFKKSYFEWKFENGNA